jgi:ketosteroid isomerase-like protein
MGEARETMDRMTRAFVEQDLDTVVNLYAVDAVILTPDLGELKGREQIRSYFQGFKDAFPDARYELVAGYEAGDVAIDEGFFVGTHTGPLADPSGQTQPATGETVRLRACDIATVEHGLVTSHRFYYDQLELLTQLGLVEEPE